MGRLPRLSEPGYCRPVAYPGKDIQSEGSATRLEGTAVSEGNVLAQLRDLPRASLQWEPKPRHHDLERPGSVEAAVLLLFGQSDNHPSNLSETVVSSPDLLDLLLLERSSTLRHHPGQIAFPGGRADPGDKGPISTALREAREETGLDPKGVEVLGTLGARPLPVSDHQVTPVLAWWRSPSPIRVVDTNESARVFRVPVSQLISPENRRTARMDRYGRTYFGPAFMLHDKVIWGFTGALLADLFTALKWDEPWDTERLVEVLP